MDDLFGSSCIIINECYFDVFFLFGKWGSDQVLWKVESMDDHVSLMHNVNGFGFVLQFYNL